MEEAPTRARRAYFYFTCRCKTPRTSGWTNSKTGLYLRWNKHHSKIVSNLWSPDILLIRYEYLSLVNFLGIHSCTIIVAALVSHVAFSVNICLFPISTEILKHYYYWFIYFYSTLFTKQIVML